MFAWYVKLGNGSEDYQLKDNTMGEVWPVRGGQ